MRKIKIVLSAILLAALLAIGAEAAETAAASKDIELTEGQWLELAKRHPIPALSKEAAEAPKAEVLAAWWDSLGDETLTKLIMMSLENNRDLASARSKVTEARASLGITKAAALPWLDTTNYWNRGNTPVTKGGNGKTTDLYRLGIDASWEIDIFGGRRQATKAGVATLEAQYASLHAAWVTLSSEVALNYLTLRTLQERLAIAKNNLDLQMQTLDMLSSRVNAGLSDELALNQAKYTMEQTRSAIPPLETNIEEVKNGLAVLTGVVPGGLEEMLKEQKPLPKAADVNLIGIPAEALRQRPDIKAAERQLAAQIARKKSARADLWPKFYLVGSIGTEATDTGSLFEGPAKAFSFGPKITWPIFHWGAIKNNIKVQGAKQEQLLAAYEQTVLTAVGEVRNALTASVQERKRNESLKRGYTAAKIALDVANDKYKNGLTDFNNVISAQRALLTLSEQFAISEGQMTSDVVRIYKALGGGWAPLDAEAQKEAAKK